MCWWLTVYPPKSSGWSSGINVSLGSLWFLMNFMKISFTSWVNVKQEVKPPCLYVQWSVNRCFDEWSRKEKLLLRSSSTATYWVHFMIFLTFPECLWNKKKQKKKKLPLCSKLFNQFLVICVWQKTQHDYESMSLWSAATFSVETVFASITVWWISPSVIVEH